MTAGSPFMRARPRRCTVVLEMDDGSVYATEHTGHVVMEQQTTYAEHRSWDSLIANLPPDIEEVRTTITSDTFEGLWINDLGEWLRRRQPPPADQRQLVEPRDSIAAAPPIALPPGAPQ
jgi:hypothetical protein